MPMIIEKLADCTGSGHLTSNYKQDAYDWFYDFLEFFALRPGKSPSDMSFPQHRFSKPVPERVSLGGLVRNGTTTVIQ